MISNLASISATCHYDVAEPERLQLLCKYVGLYRPSTLANRTMEGGEEKGGGGLIPVMMQNLEVAE